MILGYVLIALTWFIMLASTVNFWVLKGIEPPWINWVILAILAFLPFAEKLKIGDFIEVNRKVSRLRSEVDTLKNYVSNIQTQQLINVSIQGVKEATAFADAIASKMAFDYASAVEKTSALAADESQSEGAQTSDENARRLFAETSDEVLAMFTPLLQILMYVREWKRKGAKPPWKDILNVSPLHAIEELQRDNELIFHGVGDIGEQVQKQIAAVAKLMQLQADIAQNGVEAVSVEEGKKSLVDAMHAVAWLTGALSVPVAILFSLDTFLEEYGKWKLNSSPQRK